MSDHQTPHLTPLQVCEALIAPLPELEALLGYKPKAGYTYRRAGMGRAAGDLTPIIMRRLLGHARQRGIAITERHMIWGASAEEVARLSARSRLPSETSATMARAAVGPATTHGTVAG